MMGSLGGLARRIDLKGTFDIPDYPSFQRCSTTSLRPALDVFRLALGVWRVSLPHQVDVHDAAVAVPQVRPRARMPRVHPGAPQVAGLNPFLVYIEGPEKAARGVGIAAPIR